MKKWKGKMKWLLLICLFTALGAGAKYASAYFSDAVQVHNEIRPGDSNIEIVEEFEPPKELKPEIEIPKKVNIKNKGKSSAFIRCRLVLKDEAWLPFLDFSENRKDWEKGADEYYYFLQAVPKGGMTSELLKSITVKKEVPEELLKKGFSLSVYAEAYQQGEYNAGDYKMAWEHFERNKGGA